MEALLCAAVGEKGEGENVVELNPLWIAGKLYVMHDLTGNCQTLVEGPGLLDQRMSKYIQRDLKGTEFTETSTVFPQIFSSPCSLIAP
jgi:hypothetical protein